ncbi:MAG: AraC family transcriptional regulator [Spirosomataceae bacterium]
MERKNGFKKWHLDQSSLVFSELAEYDAPVKSEGVALKYVKQGEEVYLFNNRRYRVGSNQFLLTNEHNAGRVEIESKQTVMGICVNLSPDVLKQVGASVLSPNEAEPDPTVASFLLSRAMPEQILGAATSVTGHYLQNLSQYLNADQEAEVDTASFFVALAESVLSEFTHIHHQVNALKVVKPLTQKDLFLKIEKSRLIIEHDFANDLNVQQIAAEVGLSLFHFIRLFKKCYGQTPIQMLIARRMAHAQYLLGQQRFCIHEIATHCGFSDLPAFSKAFKKYTGHNPSQFKKSNF